MKFKVIGYPIGHSMSPFIHKELFGIKNISADYSSLEIASEKLGSSVKSELSELQGFNVTIPHKVEIIKYLNELDLSAEEYGAVNTVSIKNGRLYGYNTDAEGFLKGLRFSGIALSGRVAVYGYGGAARTVITECLKKGCEVTVVTEINRKNKALAVSKEISEKTGGKIDVKADGELSGKYDLLINASPVGMYPNTDASPLNEEQIDMFKAVYDIVYNPEDTQLLKKAQKLGKTCGGGLSMLVYQAARAHEIWYDAKFTREEIESVINKASIRLKEVF